ncbi:MAG: hypothetical protein ACQEP5_07295 [Actinomycetota bacterium]
MVKNTPGILEAAGGILRDTALNMASTSQYGFKYSPLQVGDKYAAAVHR